MLQPYNAYGTIHIESDSVTVWLFAFDTDGKYHKVIRTKPANIAKEYVGSIACNLFQGVKPKFKISFVNNPDGAKEAANQVGLLSLLYLAADELFELSHSATPA